MNDWVEFKNEYDKTICIRASAVLWFEKSYTYPQTLTTIYLSNNKDMILSDDYTSVKAKLIKADNGKG